MKYKKVEQKQQIKRIKLILPFDPLFLKVDNI
jgi:hypothetical protein